MTRCTSDEVDSTGQSSLVDLGNQIEATLSHADPGIANGSQFSSVSPSEQFLEAAYRDAQGLKVATGDLADAFGLVVQSGTPENSPVTDAGDIVHLASDARQEISDATASAVRLPASEGVQLALAKDDFARLATESETIGDLEMTATASANSAAAKSNISIGLYAEAVVAGAVALAGAARTIRIRRSRS
jgi:hypothetical protein